MKLEAHNLVKVYKGRRVVNDVSLSMETGETVGLLGPNGAGKTTSFYMMVGLVHPDEGRVLLDGEDITMKPMYVRARFGLGYLAQEASIFRKLTVEENIHLVLEIAGISKKERMVRTDSLLEEFGLYARAQVQGNGPFGRRAQTGGDRPLAGHGPQVHPAR